MKKPARGGSKRVAKDLSARKAEGVKGGSTNILNMKHESLKSIAQNLRG